MSAKFEADTTYLIKGRGLVLAGWVYEGIIKIGMSVLIPTFQKCLVIQGIEMISTGGMRPDVIGLLFPLGSEQDILLWNTLDVKGKVFDVEDVA